MFLERSKGQSVTKDTGLLQNRFYLWSKGSDFRFTKTVSIFRHYPKEIVQLRSFFFDNMLHYRLTSAAHLIIGRKKTEWKEKS